jgi:hypothetical protein
MRKFCCLFLTTASLLFLAGAVKVEPAFAAETGGYRQFFMDRGFMGHDFKLDLIEDKLTISFASTTIPAPGVLHVTFEPMAATSSSLGYPRFGRDVRLDWTTNAAESPQSLLVRLDDPACGAKVWRVCALEETYQGKTRIIKEGTLKPGWAQGLVRVGATFRLVEQENYMSEGYASWYAYKRCNCAASPDFPKGTLVRVTKLSEPQKSLVVKINDWGPERDIFPERAIDLDKVAFAALATTGAGVMRVRVEPLAPDDPEALAYGKTTIVQAPTVQPKPQTDATVPEWEL